MARSSYVLDSHEEFKRLDEQSQSQAFDFKAELADLKIPSHSRVLDAGSGSGIVTHHLSTLGTDLQVQGWDLSKERAALANQKYRGVAGLSFKQMNLIEMTTAEPQFDLVVCRFVLHHFSEVLGQKLLKNLSLTLNEGGFLRVIECEGLFGDVFPAEKSLLNSLKRIRSTKKLDLQSGRKAGIYFSELGLSNIQTFVIPFVFTGLELEKEIDQIERRISNASSFFEETLGGKTQLRRFLKEYIRVLRTPGCTLYYNKVITTAQFIPSGKLIHIRRK